MYGDSVDINVYDMGNIPPVELGLAGQAILWMLVVLIGVAVIALIKAIWQNAIAKPLNLKGVAA